MCCWSSSNGWKRLSGAGHSSHGAAGEVMMMLAQGLHAGSGRKLVFCTSIPESAKSEQLVPGGGKGRASLCTHSRGLALIPAQTMEEMVGFCGGRKLKRPIRFGQKCFVQQVKHRALARAGGKNVDHVRRPKPKICGLEH